MQRVEFLHSQLFSDTVMEDLKVQGMQDLEAALPLNEETLGAIGRGIAATMNQNKQSLVVQLVTPNGRILAEEIVDDITKLQSRRHFRARRGAGNA